MTYLHPGFRIYERGQSPLVTAMKCPGKNQPHFTLERPLQRGESRAGARMGPGVFKQEEKKKKQNFSQEMLFSWVLLLPRIFNSCFK